MEKSVHNVLAGAGALKFAVSQGMHEVKSMLLDSVLTYPDRQFYVVSAICCSNARVSRYQ